MTEERILSAVERIDDAMTRIEVAAGRLPSSSGSDSSSSSEAPALAELAQRHETMRDRVQAAVAELDTLMRNG